MHLQINGKQQIVPEQITISKLLEHLNLGQSKVAIEVNLEIIPCARHDDFVLTKHDVVEIIHAVGGG